MLLTGSYRRTLDEKMRLSLPKQLRQSLGDSRLFLAPGTDRALALYAEEVLSQIGLALGRLSPAAKEARSFSRLFYAQAQPVEIDRQGRLRIPPELAKLSSIVDEVMIVGIRDRIEFWNASEWDAFFQNTQPSYDTLAERVFDDAHQARPE